MHNQKNGVRKNRKPLSLRQIVLFGLLGAMTFAAKMVMSGLPNIEPVSLFILVFAAVFGWKCLYPTYLYVTMEFLYFGIGFWNINYLYVWLVPAVLGVLLRKLHNPIWWALASGIFGLAFGLLCAPVYAFVGGGIRYAWKWWLAGFSFDITHGIGNFVMALLLFFPLRELLQKLYSKIR